MGLYREYRQISIWALVQKLALLYCQSPILSNGTQNRCRRRHRL
jgi:hypothetical protein